jgi:hypothetical protein
VNNIELHIEQLVLERLPLNGNPRPLVQVAVEVELTRLLSCGGLAAPLLSGGALSRISAPTIGLHSGESPAALGRQIAGAVYGGIGQ